MSGTCVENGTAWRAGSSCIERLGPRCWALSESGEGQDQVIALGSSFEELHRLTARGKVSRHRIGLALLCYLFALAGLVASSQLVPPAGVALVVMSATLALFAVMDVAGAVVPSSKFSSDRFPRNRSGQR